MFYCSAFSELFLPGIRLFHYCSAFFRAVLTWNSTACSTVSASLELFLPGIRLLIPLFQPLQSCSCLEFDLPTVQPLSGLFLPGIRLFALLFRHFQGCSSLKSDCVFYCSSSELFLSGIRVPYCSDSKNLCRHAAMRHENRQAQQEYD